MNQRQRVILLLDEIKTVFKKKRKLYKRFDETLTNSDKRTFTIQKEMLSFKEDIVKRLRP